MIRFFIVHHYRWPIIPSIFCRSLTSNPRSSLQNFDAKTFEYFSKRRLELFAGNEEMMSNHIRTCVESVLGTSSIIDHLAYLNSKKHNTSFSQSISIRQLCDILFFAYKNGLRLDLFTKKLIESIASMDDNLNGHSLIELIHFLVLHRQKHYDPMTKLPNRTLQQFVNRLESKLTQDQISQLSLHDLSLLCSSMYRLQISLTNSNILNQISQHLIDDKSNKHLSAVDKQNFLKILTLSKNGRMDVAEALAIRFNESFEQHTPSSANILSYEIVRMTMRIAVYFAMINFYSHRFFVNCSTILQSESKSVVPIYRAKDIIQIINVLIYMGYIRHNNLDPYYLHMIDVYDQQNQFDQKPERLVDVLAPLAAIGHFPERLLEKLYTTDNLARLTEARIREKLVFISQSHKLLCSPSRPLLDQDYLDSLPHHLIGSWEIEKRRRPYFTMIMKRLLACVPDRYCVKSAFLLKHFKCPDILLRLDIHQQSHPILIEKKKGINYLDETNSQYWTYALQVLCNEEICINDPCRPLGSFYAKALQLQRLNYTPVIIYPNDTLHQAQTTSQVFEWIVERGKTTQLLLDRRE